MSKNDITGDDIKTDAPSDKFRSGWDLLWGSKKQWEVKMLDKNNPGSPIPQQLLKDLPVGFLKSFDKIQ